jgi:AraC family L-rhamnose operon regulatory protein RhaS
MHQVIPGSSSGPQQLENLMKSSETHLSCFRIESDDIIAVKYLLEIILSLPKEMFGNGNLIWQQVLAIAVLLHRNMPELRGGAKQSRDIQAIFCYLHKHIYNPELLRSPAMATQFNTTADYIGSYFQRKAGTTIRDHVRTYRKMLIMRRVASRYSLKQIAAEFGLTDESHVCRLLKNKR